MPADRKPEGRSRVLASRHGSLLVENVAPVDEIQAWAVTLEPAGGMPQPTGEMVLKG